MDRHTEHRVTITCLCTLYFGNTIQLKLVELPIRDVNLYQPIYPVINDSGSNI